MELNFTTSEERQIFLKQRELNIDCQMDVILHLMEDDGNRGSAATQIGPETSKDHAKPCSGN